MSRAGKVTVAILSWNGRRHLEHCLPALRGQRDPGVPWEVVVLDNGSWDGTSEWVREHHPEVRLLRSEVNLGFCGGNERIVAETSATSTENGAVVFLNDDTRPESDWLAALVDAWAAAPEDVAAVSGAIVDWEGERLDFGRGLLTFDGHAFQDGFGAPLDEIGLPATGSELPFACGGNMIVSRHAFREVGGFDEDYFAYLEDVDLGWRLWSAGHRVTFCAGAVVRHRSMATSALLGDANRGFLFERNAYLTAFKNFDDELWPRLSTAVWMTLVHRAQTLMVQRNPGGELLTVDPYAGLVANTAAKRDARADEEERDGDAETPAFEPSALPDPGSREPGLREQGLRELSLPEKWRGYGPKEFVRRGVRKAARAILPGWIVDKEPGTHLVDPATLAHLRAVTWILSHLDEHAEKRRRVQARRKRPDREIFGRFPLHLVPTYPGDDRLFASRAFRRELPQDLVPFVEKDLHEVLRNGG